IALCAVICGADTWVDVEEFGHAKRAWLESFLELPIGIPSHDTFGRVFARLKPEQFQACFLSWVQAINAILPAPQIAIDGKTARRPHERAEGKAAIQMVSAWARARHLVLAQRHLAEHANEKTALPFLLEQLDLAGCIVSLDAMGWHAKFARQRKRARWGVCAGRSSPIKAPCIRTWSICLPMRWLQRRADLLHDSHPTEDTGHGRVERRQ